MRRVLHVVPDSVLQPEQRDLGSTKDIHGRTQYFRERGFDVTALAHGRGSRAFSQVLNSATAAEHDTAFLEFSLSGRAVAALRRRFPHLQVLVRSENAELLHRLDWARATGATPATLKILLRGVRNCGTEVVTARSADALLSISHWEVDHYWPRLGAAAKVRWLPYFIPDDYLPEPDDGRQRPRTCVCLTSTIPNPLVADSVENLRRAVRQLPQSQKEQWRFLVTGDVGRPAGDVDLEYVGRVDSPGDVLSASSVMTLLSDYGYGFKTKVLEAVVAGNHVLVTPGLFRRIPPVLHPWVTSVDLRRPDALGEALEQATGARAPGDPNAALRARHHQLLDELFGLD